MATECHVCMLLMERKTLVEHVLQDSEDETVKSAENAVEEPKKGRSLEEKMGRIKWTGVLLNRALDELQSLKKELAERDCKIEKRLKEIEVRQRLIIQGFRGANLIKYSPPALQRIACEDAVDVAILESVFRVGSRGILPKDIVIAIDVDAEFKNRARYGLKPYHVSRRILRMNRKLFDGPEGVGERLFEKRGLGWALTSFAFDVWGEESIEKENTTSMPSLESS